MSGKLVRPKTLSLVAKTVRQQRSILPALSKKHRLQDYLFSGRTIFQNPKHILPQQVVKFTKNNLSFQIYQTPFQTHSFHTLKTPAPTLPKSLQMSSTNYPNALRFDLNAEQITKLSEELIEESKKQLDQIVQIPKEQRTFANTMDAYNSYLAKFSVTSDICYFPSQVSTDKTVRDSSTEATKKLEAFSIEVSTREDLYKAVVDYTETNASQLPKEGTEERKFIEDVIRDFKRDGLALPKEQREKVKQIKHRISELSIQFNKNNNEDQTQLLFKRDELKGLPDDYFEGRATEVKDGETYYVVTMKYPDYFPAIEQCEVDETRKKLDFAYGSRCIKENTPILEEIIQLRQEEASLLGYKSHAEYILEKRMAKNPETVLNFLNDLVQKLEAPAQKELAALGELKKKHKEEQGLPFDGKVNLWDWRFYDKMLLQKEYQIDEEKIKEYFPLDKVTTGLLTVYQDLLGLKFVLMPKDKAHVWHPDVSQYEVYDTQSGNFVGHFYLDLHPRDGKYTHAAEFSLQKGCIVNGKRQFPAAAMVANFTKPTPTKPSLLTFNEVETYFHEFGHVMHEICTGAKFYYFAGTSVERDFVEAPSQMLENWVYEESVLAIISGHYQDQTKPLPEEFRQKLIKAKYVNEAFKNRRQLHFGSFDMLVHTLTGKVDTAALWAKNMKEIALTEPQPGTNGAATFGHIVGGYSAGYYGYLWSKVYSSDMFSRFKKEGVLNKELGKLYREKILASGGTRDAMDYLIEFLGRPPSPEAFLFEIGAVQH